MLLSTKAFVFAVVKCWIHAIIRQTLGDGHIQISLSNTLKQSQIMIWPTWNKSFRSCALTSGQTVGRTGRWANRRSDSRTLAGEQPRAKSDWFPIEFQDKVKGEIRVLPRHIFHWTIDACLFLLLLHEEVSKLTWVRDGRGGASCNCFSLTEMKGCHGLKTILGCLVNHRRLNHKDVGRTQWVFGGSLLYTVADIGQARPKITHPYAYTPSSPMIQHHKTHWIITSNDHWGDVRWNANINGGHVHKNPLE